MFLLEGVLEGSCCRLAFGFKTVCKYESPKRGCQASKVILSKPSSSSPVGFHHLACAHKAPFTCGSFPRIMRRSGMDPIPCWCCRHRLCVPKSWSFSHPGYSLMLLVSHCRCWTRGSPPGSKGTIVVAGAAGWSMKGAARFISCGYRALTSSSAGIHKTGSTGGEGFSPQTQFISWKYSPEHPGDVQNTFFSWIQGEREQLREKLRYLFLITQIAHRNIRLVGSDWEWRC